MATALVVFVWATVTSLSAMALDPSSDPHRYSSPGEETMTRVMSQIDKQLPDVMAAFLLGVPADGDTREQLAVTFAESLERANNVSSGCRTCRVLLLLSLL